MYKDCNDKHNQDDLGCKPAIPRGSLCLRLTSPRVQCSLQAEGIIQHLEGLFNI